jgi:hypothetical protein
VKKSEEESNVSKGAEAFRKELEQKLELGNLK